MLGNYEFKNRHSLQSHRVQINSHRSPRSAPLRSMTPQFCRRFPPSIWHWKCLPYALSSARPQSNKKYALHNFTKKWLQKTNLSLKNIGDDKSLVIRPGEDAGAFGIPAQGVDATLVNSQGLHLLHSLQQLSAVCGRWSVRDLMRHELSTNEPLQLLARTTRSWTPLPWGKSCSLLKKFLDAISSSQHMGCTHSASQNAAEWEARSTRLDTICVSMQ